MLKRSLFLVIALFLAAPTPIAVDRAFAEGVPLPGITLFGRITDMAGTTRLTSGILQVQLTPTGGETITLVTPLMNLGGEFSYVLRVPVEILVAGETLSDNAIVLPQTSVTYNLSANVGGVAANLQGGTSSLAFSPDQHRGSVQRLDMQATGVVELVEDTNGDGTVDREDVLYWFEHWMDSLPSEFDFNGSGTIDAPDLLHLLDTIREADSK